MSKTRFVLNRQSVAEQLLKNAQILNDVQAQVEGMAQVHNTIKVFRNVHDDRGNIVATVPMSVEHAHRGMMGQILNGVRF